MKLMEDATESKWTSTMRGEYRHIILVGRLTRYQGWSGWVAV